MRNHKEMQFIIQAQFSNYILKQRQFQIIACWNTTLNINDTSR